MAVTFTNLDTNSSTADTTGSFTTASITPTANQPVLVALLTTVSGTAPTPVLSGCGLTWTLVDSTSAAARSEWLFLGIGASPSTGAISIAGDGSTNVTSAYWSVVQCAGVDTGTANGVVQSTNAKPGSGTSLSVAFGSTVTSGNGTFFGVGLNTNDSTLAPTGGWTQVGSTQAQSGPTSAHIAASASTAQQNITASWTTSGNVFVVGAELKAGSSGTNYTKSPADSEVLTGAASTVVAARRTATGSVALHDSVNAGYLRLAAAGPDHETLHDAVTKILGRKPTSAVALHDAITVDLEHSDWLPGTVVLASDGISTAVLASNGISTAAVIPAEGLGTVTVTPAALGTAVVATTI